MRLAGIGRKRPSQSAFLIATVGAGFWGLSGTAAQALFQLYGFPVVGLVTLRMLIAGSILIVVLRPAFPDAPWLRFLLLSVFGLAGSQLTYLAAISYSNAAAATLLQFLFLPMVVAYEVLAGELRWSARWALMLGLAAAGTLLLVGGLSNGNIEILVTPRGLLFGLLSAVAAAYYTLDSRRLVRESGSWAVTAWGFVVGGAVTLPFGAFTLSGYSLPTGLGTLLDVALLVGFVIVFGTLLAYGFYLSALRHLAACEVGVVASWEPISAAAAAFVFLGVVMTPVQYLGGAMIVLAVILLASLPAATKPR